MRIPLPPQVVQIYQAVAELERDYPGRKFTPDGHLVGSIGEVIAAEYFDLILCKASTKGYDARDQNGRQVEIKCTARKSVDLRNSCERLIVFRIESPQYAALAYDGPGDLAWDVAGKMTKGGWRTVTLKKLRDLDIEGGGRGRAPAA